MCFPLARRLSDLQMRDRFEGNCTVQTGPQYVVPFKICAIEQRRLALPKGTLGIERFSE